MKPPHPLLVGFLLFILLVGTLVIPVKKPDMQATAKLQPVIVAPTELSVRAIAIRAADDFALVEAGDQLGSGVITRRITPDGHVAVFVWTCAHVLIPQPPDAAESKKKKKVEPKPPAGPVVIKVKIDHVDYQAKLIAIGGLGRDEVDVALLEVMNAPLDTGSVDFDVKLPEAGSAVYMLGAAGGEANPPSFFVGVVSAPDRLMTGQVFDQLDCASFFGCSGCGVFNAEGHCIGLTESIMTASICFDTPARCIYSWAEQNHVLWAMFTTVPMPSQFSNL